eukprot:jgi/Ulvmu1/2825/UM142_0023.1
MRRSPRNTAWRAPDACESSRICSCRSTYIDRYLYTSATGATRATKMEPQRVSFVELHVVSSYGIITTAAWSGVPCRTELTPIPHAAACTGEFEAGGAIEV